MVSTLKSIELKPKILLIPLASRLLEKDTLKKVWAKILDSFQRNSEKTIFGYEQIVTERNIDKVISRINSSLQEYNGFIFVHLTGGSSKLAIEILTDIIHVKPFISWAHGKYNSLASAFHLREKISDFLNIKSNLPVLFEEYNLDFYSKILATVDFFLSPVNIIFFGSLLGVKVPSGYHVIRWTKKGRILKQNKENIISNEIAKLKKDAEILIDDEMKIRDVVNLYLNIRDIISDLAKKQKGNRFLLANIHCYQFINTFKIAPCLVVSLLNRDGYIVSCQGDLLALSSMFLLRVLTEKPVWVADISSINLEKNTITFAHYCADINFKPSNRKYSIILHPISKHPASIYIEPNLNSPITVFRIDANRNDFFILEGTVIGPQKKDPNNGIQIEVNVNKNLEEILDKVCGNHHALVYGHWGHKLRELHPIFIITKQMKLLKGK